MWPDKYITKYYIGPVVLKTKQELYMYNLYFIFINYFANKVYIYIDLN